jgi:hypothetical protein
MATKCLIHHALIRPAYWTNVGGGFMITLALDHVIFENVEGEERGGAASDPHGHTRMLPDGFARDPHETGKPFEDMGGSSTAQPPQAKRRIMLNSIAPNVPSAASLAAGAEWDLEVAPASRGITGGGGEGSSSVGSSSFRALSRSLTGAAGGFDDEQ